MDIRWKDENSMAKVQEAFLRMWALKERTTPEEIKARMAKGEKVTSRVRYLAMDTEGNMYRWVTLPVDLSRPVRIVVWYVPYGLGSCGVQRLQFNVSNESLSIFIYATGDEYLISTAAVTGVLEAMEMILNYGEPTFDDSRRLERVHPEIADLIAPLSPDGAYIPEIETIPQ